MKIELKDIDDIRACDECGGIFLEDGFSITRTEYDEGRRRFDYFCVRCREELLNKDK